MVKLQRIAFIFALVGVYPSLGQDAVAERPAGENSSNRILLFVDDHHVLYRPGTQRVFHPAKRSPQNPMFTDTEAWEDTIGYCSVHRDNLTGKYQLWYQAYSESRGIRLCYATSDDGIQWQRPNLGLFEFDGSKDNNIVLEDPEYGASVVYDSRESNPELRYKAAYFNEGMALAFSSDGIHWNVHPRRAFDRFSGGKSGQPPFPGEKPKYDPLGVSDVIDVSFDPVRQLWMAYTKTWLDGPDGTTFWRRAVVRTESEDFLSWSRPHLVSAPDEIDEAHSRKRGAAVEGKTAGGGSRGIHVHGGPTFYCGGVYFSLLQIIDSAHTGLMPIELGISRDGYNVERPFRDTPFIPVNGGDDFDSGAIWSNATPVILEDEIRFYYGAYSGNWKQGLIKKPTGIGLATIPRDRFAGIRTLDGTGQLTLRPIALRGVGAIELNADATNGTVRVEVLDALGFRIPGYTKDDALPFQGDALRHLVQWKEARLANLPDRPYTFRIHLDGDATVYALKLLGALDASP